MLTKMTGKQRLKSLVWWARHLLGRAARLVAGSRPRFLLITPALFRTQLIYDAMQKRILRLGIRDYVDHLVVCQIFVNEDYGLGKLSRAAELHDIYHSIVRCGKTPLIIDCGANCGMAIRYFTETFREALVVAVEPEPANMALARSNNASGNVAYQLAGIGSSDTRANIRDPGQGNWAYQVEEDAGGDVSIISINSLLKTYDPAQYAPFMVKIDIEGFEANLFEKNTEWIDRFPLLIIELHDWMLPGQASSRNFLQEISRRRRDFVFHGENVFSIANGPTAASTHDAGTSAGGRRLSVVRAGQKPFD